MRAGLASGGWLACFGLDANDAARNAEAHGYDDVEPIAVLVRPDGADLVPLRLAVAARFGFGYDVGGVGGLGAHSILLCQEAAGLGLDASPHGAEPHRRQGERARAAGGGSPEFLLRLLARLKIGDTRRTGSRSRRPCPEAVRCAVGFADRGSIKSAAF